MQLHARLADAELLLGDCGSEQLIPGSIQQQFWETEI
jgi:hypothetical protein